MTPELEKNRIVPQLNTRWLGQHYTYFADVDSTNLAIRQTLDRDPLPAGSIYVTDFQSQGKGRLNRRWSAPRGSSLLFSILFQPDWPVEQHSWLTIIGALAVVEAIEQQTAVLVDIKWPNDLVVKIDGVWHKLAGILTEGMFSTAGFPGSIVLGIGLNVNIQMQEMPPGQTPATSLMALTGQKINRAALLIEILNRIEPRYETAAAGQSPIPQWQGRLITLGQPVRVTHIHSRKQIDGIAEGINQYGHLLVRDASNEVHTVTAGDVTLQTPV